MWFSYISGEQQRRCPDLYNQPALSPIYHLHSLNEGREICIKNGGRPHEFMSILHHGAALLPLWLYHWIMRMWEHFQNRLIECREQRLCGIRLSMAAVITLKQKRLIFAPPPPHWGVVPGSDPSPVQRQQIALHIIAMWRGCHCLRAPNHHFFLSYSSSSRSSKDIFNWTSDYRAHNASHGVKSNFLFFSFPLRTEALSNTF